MHILVPSKAHASWFYVRLRIDKETPRIILIFIGKKDIKDKKGKLP
jgi:hypothetical protein